MKTLSKKNIERLAACASVGLSYWAQHPKSGHVWAVDDQQRAHVVQIRRDGTAKHVCQESYVCADDECTADFEEKAL